MNPFPENILSPKTAHRIPQSIGHSAIERLLAFGINAYGFLMDDDLLEETIAKGFANDVERAKADLLSQLPPEIRSEIRFEARDDPAISESQQGGSEENPPSPDVPFTSAILQLLYDHRRQQAENFTLKRNAIEELFLLGISIGKGERLSPEEEAEFRRTFGAAELTGRLISAAGSIPEMDDFRENALNTFSEAGFFKNWIQSAPEIQESLERWAGEDSPANSNTQILEGALRAFLPTQSADQAKGIAEALSMPLDRVMPDLSTTDKLAKTDNTDHNL